jgi:hypothetical protein
MGVRQRGQRFATVGVDWKNCVQAKSQEWLQGIREAMLGQRTSLQMAQMSGVGARCWVELLWVSLPFGGCTLGSDETFLRMLKVSEDMVYCVLVLYRRRMGEGMEIKLEPRGFCD